jgi:RNA polymerase primary sigma factor
MEKANQSPQQEPFILYLRKIGKNPVLTPEKENEVFRKIKEGDPKARNLMINSNLRLVVAIAKQIRTGQELPDLIAEGNIALIKAVDAFNITEGVKFSSFAGLCIKRQIFKALNTSYSTIRKPATQLKKIKEIKRISDEFKQENFREP